MSRGFFWVGTEPSRTEAGTFSDGPMYVEWESPEEVRQPYPVVLVHGGGGQGLDYLGTPDGRPGWASFLVEEGFSVYVVDRPGHGRSPYHPDLLGPMSPVVPDEYLLGVFAPPEAAAEHTQWPGDHSADGDVDRQWFSSGGPMRGDWSAMHALEQTRLAQLLDRIGPAVVVCHSAGGPAGYLAADARPELVKALVAIETVGPPFLDAPGMSLPWGVAAAPMVFDPPAADPSELQRTVDTTRGPIPVTLQQEPARRLANLSQVPIAVVTAPTSPFAHFDGHLVAFLEQAGCEVDLVRLADHGVHGNGHGMMFERNNRAVLQVILDWLAKRAA